MLVFHYGVIISLFVTFTIMSLSIAVVSFNKFETSYQTFISRYYLTTKEALTLLCTFVEYTGRCQNTEEVREMVGIVQNGRWHDSFSSVFYTLIKQFMKARAISELYYDSFHTPVYIFLSFG